MRARVASALAALLVAAGCKAPDPRQHFEVADIETYWAVESPRGETQYIAPVVRFRLRNRGAEPSRSVQAQAVFHRVGEEDKGWGSDWKEVAPSRKPVPPGGELFVELKSDGHYYTTGTPESMFIHEAFRDAKADVFLREGSSGWIRMAAVDVERRIGSKTAVVPVVPIAPAR
jgi:hypothetical protein